MKALLKLIRVFAAWEEVKDLDRSGLPTPIVELLAALEDLF